MEKVKLTLSHPIMVNGVERSEFMADPEAITVEQFDKIDALCAGGKRPDELAAMAEFDCTRHRYIAMMAICANDPEIDIEDLRRIRGVKDLEALRVIGRNFSLGGLGETSQANNSEKQSESIPTTTTPAAPKSDE